jgi:Tfp pilus assembly protein PilO
MLQKNTKISFIIIFILDLVFIVAFFAMFIFVQRKISDTIEKEDNIRNEIKKVESNALMDKELSNNKNYTDKLSEYIVSSNGIIDFIDILEKSISDNNLKSDIKSLVYEVGSIPNLELARIKIDVTGEWKNVIFFLKLLENYPLKISIENVSFKRFSEYKVGSKNIPQWVGSFEFTVLKYKEIE